MRTAACLLLALCCVSCTPKAYELTYHEPVSVHSLPPYEPSDDPWQGIIANERELRDNTSNYHDHSELWTLYYPTTKSLLCVSRYIDAGRDFLAKDDLPSSAHVFWAAMSLLGSSQGSRFDKEVLRQRILEGLAKIAEKRGQGKYARLLLCVRSMSEAYTGREEQPEHEEYWSGLRSALAACRSARAARAAAMAAYNQQALALQLQATTYQLEHINNPASLSEALEFSQAQMSQAFESVAQLQEFNATMESLEQDLKADAEVLKELAGENMEEVLAGNNGFAANSILFYLSSADDPSPYLEILHEYAQEAPKLLAAVKDMQAFRSSARIRKTSSRDPRLMEIGRQVWKLEVYIEFRERRVPVKKPEGGGR